MGKAVEKFIERWKDSGGSELANSQLFLSELCDLLEVPRPEPAQPQPEANAYTFERQVIFHNGDGSTSPGRVDLYKRGRFVLESKQGVLREDARSPLAALVTPKAKSRKGAATRDTRGWDVVMLRAKGQAEGYVRALPAEEGRPPFIVVVDVGHSLELYSEFSMTGGAYIHYPDPQSYRILLEDLHQAETRELLRQVWQNPLALDPSRRAAKVTREIAAHLAELAKSLEAAGHRPEDVAKFLTRCLFTMFAEDVNLLPSKGFARLLAEVEHQPAKFKPMAEDLWRQMKTGGFSSFLMEKVPHFNGYLFAEAWALDLDADQVALLRQAAQADWRDVEPAIFGTLLERALDPVERHKLGAHYTPRAYVERLVMPTIVEPLRAQWDGVKAAVVNLTRQGQESKALEELREFNKRLCEVRILDPACGTGNFLYVSLEHLKRLEGEVLEMAEKLGHRQTGFDLASGRTVDPHQFLGIEINPRAAAIAELVLWIGYLQWHFRTQGQTNPPEPIIRDFKNIECRDAVLAWDKTKPEIDPQTLKTKTRWDGRTYKKSPVTGEDIPDESARVLVEKYINPRKAKWPKADFVVGNPPFIGKGDKITKALGEGYVKGIRAAYNEVNNGADYVLFWWNNAADLLKKKRIKRFGLISTNSISQILNRKIIEKKLDGSDPISIAFAINDHPWVDASDGANVRIAMTVAVYGRIDGLLGKVIEEQSNNNNLERQVVLAWEKGRINPDLTVGTDITQAVTLKAANRLHSNGVMLAGSGFIVDINTADKLWLGNKNDINKIIKPYRNGRDLTGTCRNAYVIDLFGLELQEVAIKYPSAYQWVIDRVKPEREVSEDDKFKEVWWQFGRPRPMLREALAGISRYIVTPETAKHRFFIFLESNFIPDHMLIAIALDDAYYLGILSSYIHVLWALRAGGKQGVGNDPRYNKSKCLESFPFPDPPEALKAQIREFGERLDALRKRQQEMHPDLTMTGMYNVLAKLRAGQELTAKERVIHEKGLVSVLKQIHDELDAAVFQAYGWPATLSDEEILERLVALNKERAAEEAQGLIRWLRPEYQAPTAQPQVQGELAGMAAPALAAQAPAEKQPWPTALAAQAQAVRQALEALAAPADVATVAKCFARAPRARVAELLETLAGLGQARVLEAGRYAGR